MVFDVLRATSTIVTALEHGVKQIVPMGTTEEALAMVVVWPDALLGGERNGDKVEGFDLGNSPEEYLSHSGQSIILTTTNGTGAIRACMSASTTLIGSLLNMGALVEAVESLKPEQLLVVCAGTGDQMALEDVWAAGLLVSHFRLANWSDAAFAAVAVHQQNQDVRVALRSGRNGARLVLAGRSGDIDWCAGISRFQTVGEYKDSIIQAWKRE